MAEKEYKALDLIEELGVCRSTVYRLLQRGAIKAYKRWGTSKRGDVWVIPQSALDEYRGVKIDELSKYKNAFGAACVLACEYCNACFCPITGDNGDFTKCDDVECETCLQEYLLKRAESMK